MKKQKNHPKFSNFPKVTVLRDCPINSSPLFTSNIGRLFFGYSVTITSFFFLLSEKYLRAILSNS